MTTSHDSAKRRKAQRHGRERGCWVYIPAEILQEAGRSDPSLPVHYRVWGRPGGSVLVRLYRQP